MKHLLAPALAAAAITLAGCAPWSRKAPARA